MLFVDVTIATKASRSPATWSSTCAHTPGRSPTSASSVAVALSPPGSSSPTRRHTQVIVCCALEIVHFSLCSQSRSAHHYLPLGCFYHPKETLCRQQPPPTPPCPQPEPPWSFCLHICLLWVFHIKAMHDARPLVTGFLPSACVQAHPRCSMYLYFTVTARWHSTVWWPHFTCIHQLDIWVIPIFWILRLIWLNISVYVFMWTYITFLVRSGTACPVTV